MKVDDKRIEEYLLGTNIHPNARSYTQPWLCEIVVAWWNYKNDKDPINWSWTVDLEYEEYSANFSTRKTFATKEEAKEDALKAAEFYEIKIKFWDEKNVTQEERDKVNKFMKKCEDEKKLGKKV